MNKNIVILGCPRSGTSLVANLVKSAGYDPDYNGTRILMKPNPEFNPDGYFERLDLVKTNDELIKNINSDYSFLNPPSIKEIKNNNKRTQKLDILEYELNNYERWFIKDSRLCFTLNLYNLKNIYAIKVIRSSESVKKSMINHYGDIFSKDIKHGPHYVKKIDFYNYYTNINECIDWQIKSIPNITIQYEDLIDNKIEDLEKFLDFKVNSNLINLKYIKYAM
jgi:hypothetical protein